MRLPKSFNDITVSKFQECYFLLNQPVNKEDPFAETDRWIKVISTLGDIPHKNLENLPKDQLSKLIKQLSFLLDDERLNTKVKKYICLNKRVYKAVYKAQKLSTVQAIDIHEFMKPQDNMSEKDMIVLNAHKLLASIYLQLTVKGWIYNSDEHERTSNDFLTAKMGDVYGTLFFYSIVWENWIKSLVESGTQALQTIAEHMKEVEEWMGKENLEKGGVGLPR